MPSQLIQMYLQRICFVTSHFPAHIHSQQEKFNTSLQVLHWKTCWNCNQLSIRSYGCLQLLVLSQIYNCLIFFISLQQPHGILSDIKHRVKRSTGLQSWCGLKWVPPALPVLGAVRAGALGVRCGARSPINPHSCGRLAPICHEYGTPLQHGEKALSEPDCLARPRGNRTKRENEDRAPII